jgi:hypothetical protein
MKAETNDNLDLAPRQERALLDQIRKDHDLIARLSITPQELEALSKCALLGTLTCKQDMLFILRQIREATSPTIDHTILFPQPPSVSETEEEDPVPGLRQIAIRVAPTIIPQPDMRETVEPRRISAKVAVLFLMVAVVAGMAWNGMLIMSRLRDTVMTTIGTLVSQGSSSDAWYDRLDHLETLLFWETLTVVALATVVYLKSKRDSRRFKVRPGQRL